MIKYSDANIMQENGKVIRQIRTTLDDKIHPVQQMGRTTILPGGEIAFHKAECDEIYLVISGDLACNDNGQEDVLHPEDSLICRVGESCGLANKTDAPVEIMEFIFYR